MSCQVADPGPNSPASSPVPSTVPRINPARRVHLDVGGCRHPTCPAPGYPPSYLGTLNPWTGRLTAVPLTGPSFRPQGMVFVSPGWVVTPG
jgi:hypothetical protein